MYDQMGTTLHHGDKPSTGHAEKFHGNFIDNYDAVNTYHTYGWEWNNDHAIWTIDGQVVTILNSYQLSNAWPNEDFYFIYQQRFTIGGRMGRYSIPK